VCESSHFYSGSENTTASRIFIFGIIKNQAPKIVRISSVC
jgi:hypothetical protein